MPARIRAYIAVWAAFAILATVAAGLFGSDRAVDGFVLASLAIALAFTMLAPLRVEVDGEIEGLEIEEAVILPALILLPALPTIPVFACATAVVMVVRRRGFTRGGFNVAQWTAATAAGFLVHDALATGDTLTTRVITTLPAIVVFAAVNQAAVSGVLALATGRRLIEVVRDGFRLRASLFSVNIAFGCLLTAVGSATPKLLPVAFVPIVATGFAYSVVAQRQAIATKLQRVATHELHIAEAETVADVAERAAEAITDVVASAHAVVTVDGTTQARASVGTPPGAPTADRGLRADRSLRSGGSVTVEVAERPNLDTYDDDDRTLLTSVIGRAGASIDRLVLGSRLDQQERRYADVVEVTTDGMLVVDRHQIVQAWNPAIADMIGVIAENAIGQPCCRLFLGVEPVTGGTDGCVCGPSVEGVVDIAVAGHALRCTVLPVNDGDLGITVVDDTARVQREQLEVSFVATISHELRTPLTPMKGGIHLLRTLGPSLPEEQRTEMLSSMERQVDRLERVVGLLLDATTLDHPGFVLRPTPTDVSARLTALVDDVRNRYAGRTVTLHATPGLTWPVDAGRFDQVVSALVDNALLHTRGDVEVSVHADDHLRVAVADRGAGIPAADRTRIFDRFVRLGDYLTSEVGGTGSGLYIARRLVEHMDGVIDVHPREGGGSVFAIALPEPTEHR